jgi:hypothetical protein
MEGKIGTVPRQANRVLAPNPCSHRPLPWQQGPVYVFATLQLNMSLLPYAMKLYSKRSLRAMTKKMSYCTVN